MCNTTHTITPLMAYHRYEVEGRDVHLYCPSRGRLLVCLSLFRFMCSSVGQQAIMGDYGDWESDAQAVAGYMESALRADAGPDTVPLVYPSVQSPGQIAAHFGGPTYNKGGSLLRMIRAMLGDGPFQTACRQFLTDNKFSNALSVDLFRYFAANFADQSVDLQSVLAAWGNQRGFPLVTVTDESTATQRVWRLSQRQYNLTDGSHWPVWVQYSYRSAGGVQGVSAVWLNSSNEYSAVISAPLDAQYVKLNHNRTSFYRVQYPSFSVYDSFRTALITDGSTLTKQDRIGLIADAYWTQMDGYLNSWPVLINSTLRILAREANYPVWATGVAVLSDMWGRMRFAIRNDTGLGTARSYIRMLTSHAADMVPWALDTRTAPAMHLAGMMQVVFGPLACRFHLQPCLGNASLALSYWAGNGSVQSALPTANLRTLTLAYGRYGTPEASQWAEQLFNLYLDPASSPTRELATLYLEAAMVAAQPKDIVNFTAYIVSSQSTGNPLRFTDTVANVFGRLHQLNDMAHPTLVELLTGNPGLFDTVAANYDNDMNRAAFNTMIDIVVGASQRTTDIDELRSKVLTDDKLNKLTQAAKDKINQAIATAQRNTAWVESNWPQIREAMQAALDTRDV